MFQPYSGIRTPQLPWYSLDGGQHVTSISWAIPTRPRDKDTAGVQLGALAYGETISYLSR